MAYQGLGPGFSSFQDLHGHRPISSHASIVTINRRSGLDRFVEFSISESDKKAARVGAAEELPKNKGEALP